MPGHNKRPPKMIEPASGTIFGSDENIVDIEFSISDCSKNTNYTVSIYLIVPGQPNALVEKHAATVKCNVGDSGRGTAFYTTGALIPGDYLVTISTNAGPEHSCGTFTISATNYAALCQQLNTLYP